jgi:hypothetical protein
MRRLLRRLHWGLYSRRVGARRWTLDLALPPNRRATILRRSCTARDWDAAIFAVAPPISVEPRYGYLVSGRLGVIDESVMSSECVRIRRQRAFFSGVPTLGELLSGDRKRAMRVAPLVSIQHAFGGNYYHAVIDCLGALAFLAERGELLDTDVVVDAELAETAVFRAMLDHGVISRDRLVIRSDQWITSDQPIRFVRQESLNAHALRRTASFVGGAAPPAPSGPSGEWRLYVTRGEGGLGRSLRNEAELIAALQQRRFQVVDPGSLSWDKQYALFRRATQVVGIHGAALTNVLFRWPGSLSVLEITAPGNAAEVFKMMALALDYRFARIEGCHARGRRDRPSFVVDVSAVLDVVDGWGSEAEHTSAR